MTKLLMLTALLGSVSTLSSTTCSDMSPGNRQVSFDAAQQASAKPNGTGSASLLWSSEPTPLAPNHWRDMLGEDLDAATRLLLDQDILAAYPDQPSFVRQVEQLRRQALAEATAITDFPTYRAVLTHFFAGIDDAHAGLLWSLTQTNLKWPGFVSFYTGRDYRVRLSSLPSIPDGGVISSCDGIPVQRWIDLVSPYEGGHTGIGATNFASSLRLFVDNGNAFVRRPKACVINGKNIGLTWSSLAYPNYAQRILPLFGVKDRSVGVEAYAANSVWVRLGNFEPQTSEEADRFRAVVAQMPNLRRKRLIILDVRQNGGGSYDWFMQVLRSLYGTEYADTHARARLTITPVYRATPEILDMFRREDAEDARLGSVIDADTSASSTAGVAKALQEHQRYYRGPAPQTVARSARVVTNPVQAKVVVLTDYGCSSACIVFVDELKRFPGVQQIGFETAVDNRTGTPMTVPLPSGNGMVRVPVMTRDGRERGDNVPQKPDIPLIGDPADTANLRNQVRMMFHTTLAK